MTYVIGVADGGTAGLEHVAATSRVDDVALSGHEERAAWLEPCLGHLRPVPLTACELKTCPPQSDFSEAVPAAVLWILLHIC